MKTRNIKPDRRRGMQPKRGTVPADVRNRLAPPPTPEQAPLTPEALARMERIQTAAMEILKILDGWTLAEAVMILQTTASQIDAHIMEFRNTEVICAHPEVGKLEETVTEKVTETEPEFKSVD